MNEIASSILVRLINIYDRSRSFCCRRHFYIENCLMLFKLHNSSPVLGAVVSNRTRIQQGVWLIVEDNFVDAEKLGRFHHASGCYWCSRPLIFVEEHRSHTSNGYSGKFEIIQIKLSFPLALPMRQNMNDGNDQCNSSPDSNHQEQSRTRVNKCRGIVLSSWS